MTPTRGGNPTRVNKANEAYAFVKRKILRGEYAPGCRVVVSDLVKETGLSAIPLREGIRKLESEGWIESIPNVGSRVAPFDVKSHKQTMELLARLEGYATALAAPLLSSQDYKEAHELNDELASIAADDGEEERFSLLNEEFHDIIFRSCNYPYLRSLIKIEIDRLLFIKQRVVFAEQTGKKQRRINSVLEHEKLLSLMEEGAPSSEIEIYARDHKLNALNYRHRLSD